MKVNDVIQINPEHWSSAYPNIWNSQIYSYFGTQRLLVQLVDEDGDAVKVSIIEDDGQILKAVSPWEIPGGQRGYAFFNDGEVESGRITILESALEVVDRDYVVCTVDDYEFHLKATELTLEEATAKAKEVAEKFGSEAVVLKGISRHKRVQTWKILDDKF